MRDKSLDTNSFLNQLKRLCERSSTESELLSTTVMDSPNFLEEYTTDLVLPRTLDDCIALAVSSWYLKSRELAVLIQHDLAMKAQNEDFWILRFFLKSKAHTEIFLLETQLYHTRDFFGNLITRNRLQRIYSLLTFQRLNKVIVQPQRKRGYHDKGSMKCHSKWLPTHDYSLDRLQEEIESKRKSLTDTYLFAEGFIT